MKVKERVAKLQKLMDEKGIDIYIVTNADFHDNKYVEDYFKAREYMTGFTGSAGTAVFARNKAGLWTDGRYFIQGKQELSGTGVKLYEMGEEGVPTIDEFLKDELASGGTIGFDSRTVVVNDGLKYKEIAKAKDGNIVYDLDLVGMIWDERPPLSENPATLLEEKYTGENASSKLKRVRDVMDKEGASAYLLTTIDDICWLLNIRGSDIKYVTFVLSYLAVWKDKCYLYIDDKKLSQEVANEMDRLGVSVKEYNEIYKDVTSLGSNEVVLLEPDRVNFMMYSSLPKDVTVIKRDNVVANMKTIKNQVELECTRNAHIRDGVASTKFMYWLKNHPDVKTVDEIYAAKKIVSLRQEQEGFISPSFNSICAFNQHGAMAHYSVTKESSLNLEGDGFFLVDSGGHYFDGTTDITRTYVIGEVTTEQKRHFTTVAVGMLKLSNVVFPYGCTGQNLDVLARETLWRQGLDYNHRTGHGVGHVGGVHEGPISIYWKKGKVEPVVIEENMVFSNEPGIYLEGKYGIRLENELIARKGEKTSYGQFMYFETITFAPLDLDGILPEFMSEYEIQLLNDYHKKVYEKISPLLTDDERKWLREVTREVKRD